MNILQKNNNQSIAHSQMCLAAAPLVVQHKVDEFSHVRNIYVAVMVHIGGLLIDAAVHPQQIVDEQGHVADVNGAVTVHVAVDIGHVGWPNGIA